MASQLYLNSGQLWSPIFFTKFHQFLAVFYLLLIVQLCSADSLNENLVKYADNIPGTDFISDNQARMNDIREPYKEEIHFRPIYSYPKIPFEIVYRMIGNQYDQMERLRKYDPSDRSFIRFGRSAPSMEKKSKPINLRPFFSYIKRPATKDTSFIRFGKRSVNKN